MLYDHPHGARSHFRGNLVGLGMAPSSQGLEPPGNPARFIAFRRAVDGVDGIAVNTHRRVELKKERSFCSVTCGYAFVVWRSRKDARNHLAAKRNLRWLVLQTGRGAQPCRHDYNQAGHHYAANYRHTLAAQRSVSPAGAGTAAERSEAGPYVASPVETVVRFLMGESVGARSRSQARSRHTREVLERVRALIPKLLNSTASPFSQ
ncbi:MAG: hypothetical protein DMD89_20825 [Candidatus Rokuibacteriota bacterium]|nr:MAG: hypothetical protein DMD89_20825 [Candidatus Rokubacteria bacterium]